MAQPPQLSVKEEDDEGEFFIMRKPTVPVAQEKPINMEPKPQSIPDNAQTPNMVSSSSPTAIVAAAIQAVAGGMPNLNADLMNRLVSQPLPTMPQLYIPLPAFTVSVPQTSSNNAANPEMKFIVLPVHQCWGCRKEFTDVTQFHEHVNKFLCLTEAAQLPSDTSTSMSVDTIPEIPKTPTPNTSSNSKGKQDDSIDDVIEGVLRKIREETLRKERAREVKMEVGENSSPVTNDSNNNKNHSLNQPSFGKDSNIVKKPFKSEFTLSSVKSLNPSASEMEVDNAPPAAGSADAKTSTLVVNGFQIKQELSALVELPDIPKDLQIVDDMDIHPEHPARLTKAIYSCGDCTSYFHTNIGLLRHQSAAHGAQQFNCDVVGCSKVFKNDGALADHKKRVHGPRSFACVHCNAYFTTETYLKAHIKIHMDKKHVCRVCSHGFVNKTDLNNHMRVHTGVKPYNCKVCGKAFRHVSGYYTHVRIHTGETPYECEFCHKKFTNASNFQTHRKIHTQDKKFKCEVCDKEFIQQSNFTRHKRTHTKERPYECTECSESFSYSTCLKKHLKRDHGVEPLECDHCKRTFLNDSSFVRHRTGCQFKDIVKKEAETDSAQFL